MPPPINGILPVIINGAAFHGTTYTRPAELVRGLLHRGSKLSLGGSSKAYKTWILLDLAFSVSTGTPWLGIPTTQGRVLYINLEIQPEFFHDRFVAIAHQKGLTTRVDNIDIWNLRGFAASYVELIPQILAVIRDRGYSLIIVDPIYKIYGNSDENSAKDVALLLNSLDRVTKDATAALGFGAHFAKGNASAKESIDRVSGSGVFARDPDTILTFTQHVDDDTFIVEATLRNFPPLPRFCVKWEYPLMRLCEAADPSSFRRPGAGRKEKCSVEDFMSLVPPEGVQNRDWMDASVQKFGISKAQFFVLRKRAAISGLLKPNDGNGLWIPEVV